MVATQRKGRFAAVVTGGVTNAGLPSVDQDFLQAVIRYGHFAELHFFLKNSELQPIQTGWQGIIEEYGSDQCIQFIDISLLPAYIAQYEYSVFHKGDPSIAELAAIRDCYAKTGFPITGRVQQLSTDNSLSRSRDLVLSAIKPCDAILCHSMAQQQAMEYQISAARDSISAYSGATVQFTGKLSVLPFGIDTRAERVYSRKEAASQLGFNSESLILLGVGCFSPADSMDLHPLLLAANDLLESKGISDFLLVLAGEGDASSEYMTSLLFQAYELNLESHIRLELVIDSARRQLLFEAADIFVSLADNVQEQEGTALLEAMKYSLPVVLSDWGGHRELVESGVNGFLVDTLSANYDEISQVAHSLNPEQGHLIEAQGVAVNIDILVDKLQLLIEDERLRTRMGLQAQARTELLFGWQSIIDNYHRLVEQLCQEATALKPLSKKPLNGVSCRPPGFSFHQLFGHYSTAEVDDADYVITTDRAIRIVLKVEKGFHFASIHYLLDQKTIEALVVYCLNGVQVKKIRQKFSDIQSLDFILLWMCKYQLAQVEKKPLLPVQPRIKDTRENQNKNTVLPFSGEHAEHAKIIHKLVSAIEPRRVVYITPILNWLARQFQPHISALDASQGELLAALLKSQVPLIDEKLLQAISWYSKDHQLDHYSDILDQLGKDGGLEALRVKYPHSFRLGKRMLLNECQGIRRLFQRLTFDLTAINDCFGQYWPKPAKGVVKLERPATATLPSVMIITFDNGQKLVYKARDIRIDAAIVGKGGGQLSLAEQLNQWLGEMPGIGTIQCLPRSDRQYHQQCHYGYCEFIHSTGNKTLSAREVKAYYQRQGVMMGLALMLGLSDLHQSNLIVSEGVPYFIDLERVFYGGVYRSLERELRSPTTAFVQGMSDTSLEKTSLPHIWQDFETSRIRLCDIQLENNQLIPVDPLEWLPVTHHIIKTETGVNRGDQKFDTLVAKYADSVCEGLVASINSICAQRDAWFNTLEHCSSFQIRVHPMLGYDEVNQRIRDLHVFQGFQPLSHARLKNYMLRIARHLSLAGEETQKWFEPHWREPVNKLAPSLAEAMINGQQGVFVRYAADSSVYIRNAGGDLKPVNNEYFQSNMVNISKAIFEIISKESIKKEQFFDSFSHMLSAFFENILE